MAIGGNIGENIGELVKEAQKMQQRMQDAQKELGDLTVEGRSGGNMITVTIDGRHRMRKLDIKPQALEEDTEFLADLVIAAYNDALKKVEEASKRKITTLTEGLNLPTDLMEKMKEEGQKGEEE